MKKLKIIMIIMLGFLVGILEVSAKDTVYSMNQYQDEKLEYMTSSYNKKKEVDGFVMAGTALKEEWDIDGGTYQDYQVIVVKYKKNGEIAWTYEYGKNREDKLLFLEPSYSQDQTVDSYLIGVEKTYDIGDEKSGTTLIKLGIDGKLVWEKDLEEKLEKAIPIDFNNYIAIGENVLLKLDQEGTIQWKVSEENYQYLDIAFIKEEQTVVGYAVIRSSNDSQELVRYNLEGKEEKTLEKLDKYISSYLETTDNGFILYGITPEVKLKKGEKSYYLIYYNHKNEEEWETIGDVPVEKKKKIKLLSTQEGYLLLYGNSSDSSYEVIKLDKDGVVGEKVKKITNNYYDIENFSLQEEKLYFIGQINCPEDDNCEYDLNSLFLISDEDKVIEVEDNTSRNILIGVGVLILGIIFSILLQRKKKLG